MASRTLRRHAVALADRHHRSAAEAAGVVARHPFGPKIIRGPLHRIVKGVERQRPTDPDLLGEQRKMVVLPLVGPTRPGIILDLLRAEGQPRLLGVLLQLDHAQVDGGRITLSGPALR